MAGKIFRIYFATRMACITKFNRGQFERALMWDDDPQLGYDGDDEMTASRPWCMGDALQSDTGEKAPKKVRFHCTKVRYFDKDEPPAALVHLCMICMCDTLG